MREVEERICPYLRIIITNRIALMTYILCYITINVENKRQLEKEQYEKKC